MRINIVVSSALMKIKMDCMHYRLIGSNLYCCRINVCDANEYTILDTDIINWMHE